MNLRALAIILLVTATLCGQAQTIQPEPFFFGSIPKVASDYARSNKLTDWPEIESGDRGTQLDITFAFRNVTAYLFSRPALSESEANRVGKALAKAWGLPKAYVSYADGASCLRFPLEQSLKRRTTGMLGSIATLDGIVPDLSALGQLQSPLAISLESNPDDHLWLTTGNHRERLQPWQGWVGTVPTNAILQFESKIGWQHYLGSGLLLALALCHLLMYPVRCSYALAKRHYLASLHDNGMPDASQALNTAWEPSFPKPWQIPLLFGGLISVIAIALWLSRNGFLGKILFTFPGPVPGPVPFSADTNLELGAFLGLEAVLMLGLAILAPRQFSKTSRSLLLQKMVNTWRFWCCLSALLFAAAAAILFYEGSSQSLFQTIDMSFKTFLMGLFIVCGSQFANSAVSISPEKLKPRPSTTHKEQANQA